VGRSAADFGKLVADKTEKWAKVIRAANIKPAAVTTGAPNNLRRWRPAMLCPRSPHSVSMPWPAA
jgi:hypothetical protein